MAAGQKLSNGLTPDARHAIATSSGLKVRRAARRITQFFERLTVRSGLSVAQFDLMVHVAVAPVHTLGELAARIGIDQTTLSRNLRTLENQRLVIMARDEADRRLRSVSLTEVGQQRLKAALPIWCNAQDSLAYLVEPDLVSALDAATELLNVNRDACSGLKIPANTDRTSRRVSANQLAPRRLRHGSA
jgi:DNA-binding MarR family transcriptional regulator